MTRAWVAALGALALPGAAPAAAPACAAQASLEPADAVVGQQVLYRVRILSRPAVSEVEWAEPPVFAGLRVEWLPGDPSAGEQRRFGADYRVREERRALFPGRAGVIAVRAPDLLCTVAGASAERAAVPVVTLRAVGAPPGAPASFTGLAGPLDARVVVTPRSVSLGQTVRVAVSLRGSGNLWLAPEPFPDEAAFGGAEVFRRRAQPLREPGERLLLRRHLAYDVVPREEGTLRVPAVRIPYLDPDTRRYAWAETEPVEIPVGPRAAVPPGAPAPATEEPRAGPGASPGPPSALGRSARLLVMVTGFLALAGLYGLRRRADRGAAAAAPLAEARAARERGDSDAEAAALARALRAALASQVEGAADLAPEQIAARAERAPVRAAARLLGAAERARFDPDGHPLDAAAVERALAAL